MFARETFSSRCFIIDFGTIIGRWIHFRITLVEKELPNTDITEYNRILPGAHTAKFQLCSTFPNTKTGILPLFNMILRFSHHLKIEL